MKPHGMILKKFSKLIKLTSIMILLFSFNGYQLMIAVTHAVEIYKWIDEKGNVHYGDLPSDQTAEKIDIKNSTGVDPAYQYQLDKQTRLLEILNEERQERKENKVKIKLENEKRKANCILAKKYLDETKNASFLFQRTDDPLNPRILSHAERAKETAKAEAEVQRWCR